MQLLRYFSLISRQFVHILRGGYFVWPHSYKFIFAKSYVCYELPIRINLYELPTLNPAPKPTRHWGLDKSYATKSHEWGRTN